MWLLTRLALLSVSCLFIASITTFWQPLSSPSLDSLNEPDEATKSEREILSTVELAAMLKVTGSSDSKLFSYRTTTAQPCASRTLIDDHIAMIDTLYTQAQIRVFPRNGFLLGVVRHGGFLPNEGIDADLGVMYQDVKELEDGTQVHSAGGTTYTLKKAVVSRWPTFDGRDPFSSQKYDFIELRIQSPTSSFSAFCFFPYGSAKHGQVFYPRYAVKGFNLHGAIQEAVRWNEEGANLKVLGPNNQQKSLLDAGKPEVNIGTIFDEEWFKSLVPTQFYYSTILIPHNSHRILQNYYGRHCMNVEKRIEWQSIPLPVSGSERNTFMKNGPLPLCRH